MIYLILLLSINASVICNSPTDKTDFVIVGIPDPQYYSMSWPEVLNSQTEWVANNKNSIDFAVCFGDLVQTYDDLSQWDVADTCFAQLDGNVPYLVVAGNHDVSNGSWINYDTYFPYTRFDTCTWYGGHYPDTSNYCSYGFIVIEPDSFLIIGLSWCPDSGMINWADSILTLHSNLTTVFFTHNYLYTDGTRSDTIASYNTTCDYGYYAGEQMWGDLISNYSNILLIMSGHYHGDAEKLDFINGKPIHQHIYNYQDYNPDVKGGNGWLRIYTISYNLNRIKIETYSPYLDCYKWDECFSVELYEEPTISAKQN